MLHKAITRLQHRAWWEAAFWAAALVALAATDPATDGLFSLCLLKALGAAWCPGCGLGHSIAHLLDGAWAASFAAHPLGGPALLVIIGRLAVLARQTLMSRRAETS